MPRIVIWGRDTGKNLLCWSKLNPTHEGYIWIICIKSSEMTMGKWQVNDDKTSNHLSIWKISHFLWHTPNSDNQERMEDWPRLKEIVQATTPNPEAHDTWMEDRLTGFQHFLSERFDLQRSRISVVRNLRWNLCLASIVISDTRMNQSVSNFLPSALRSFRSWRSLR